MYYRIFCIFSLINTFLYSHPAGNPPFVPRRIRDRASLAPVPFRNIADVEPEQHETDAGRDHEQPLAGLFHQASMPPAENASATARMISESQRWNRPTSVS